uniref:VPS37 C-terminal domain-containing protein n=1 Tax=Eptatretus burgeri TaxID=7764 RepID=A0A8C4QPS4_EPTBU
MATSSLVQCWQLPEALLRKLSGLSIQELKELLENESKLDQMILETDEVKNLQVDKELCLTSNRSLAEGNLQHQPQLESGRVTLANKYQQLGNLNERYVDKRTQLVVVFWRESFSSSESLESLLVLALVFEFLSCWSCARGLAGDITTEARTADTTAPVVWWTRASERGVPERVRRPREESGPGATTPTDVREGLDGKQGSRHFAFPLGLCK